MIYKENNTLNGLCVNGRLYGKTWDEDCDNGTVKSIYKRENEITSLTFETTGKLVFQTY